MWRHSSISTKTWGVSDLDGPRRRVSRDAHCQGSPGRILVCLGREHLYIASRFCRIFRRGRRGGWWARAATWALRLAAISAVGRRMLSSKKDRIRRRPSANGFFQPLGIRMVPSPRAGQTTTDEGPRNTKSRKSFFHRRLEPADERYVCVSKRTREIVGLEDYVARTTHGTEEAN